MERLKRRGLRALGAAIVMSAFACGLAKEGLLIEGDDTVDAGDGTAPLGDVITSDTSADERAAPEETGPDVNAPETPVDARRDARIEAGPDVRAEAEAGGGADADADADGGANADATPSDADAAEGLDADAARDATPDVTSDDGVDGPAAITPSPIVWDGGPIADPQLTDSDWIQFCAALAGCGELPSLTACDALLKQPYSSDALFPPPNMVANVDNASPNCTVVADALGDGQACSAPDTCTGDIFVTCRWGFRMTVDCSGLGMVCSSGANAGCGFGTCAPEQEGQTYCVGPTYVAKCVNGRYVPSLDCDIFAATCQGPPGAAGCVGPAAACTASACTGSSMDLCMGGFLGSFECSLGYGPSFTCLNGDGGAGAGLPVCARGTACDALTWQDSCVGANVSFCNAGVPALYNCNGNAWSGCSGGKCFP